MIKSCCNGCYTNIFLLSIIVKTKTNFTIIICCIRVNNIIIYFNVFQFEAAQRLLFYKTSPENWSLLKMFLLLLNRCPRKVVGINGSTIMVGDIEMEDEACQLVLQDLDKGSNGQWSLP